MEKIKISDFERNYDPPQDWQGGQIVAQLSENGTITLADDNTSLNETKFVRTIPFAQWYIFKLDKLVKAFDLTVNAERVLQYLLITANEEPTKPVRFISVRCQQILKYKSKSSVFNA